MPSNGCRRASGSALITAEPRAPSKEREEELVNGYGEFLYAGIVTVTAGTLADLEAAADEITQVAASTGLELRPLHGRHDQAIIATLPVARGLAPKGHR